MWVYATEEDIVLVPGCSEGHARSVHGYLDTWVLPVVVSAQTSRQGPLHDTRPRSQRDGTLLAPGASEVPR